ncbi:MAG: DMT family permease [Parcubacteria group bacterium GW2011_GWA1_60_11]|nr:MAG: DMT family permease [Parcubacteria group bacterium GW2011_GWA1_60_11]
MNWLLVALLGQLLSAAATLIDKILLTRSSFRPVSYAFWLGILGAFAVFLVPFGFEILSFRASAFAALSGATFIYGLYFFFLALRRGEFSGMVPALGGITPVAALLSSAVIAGTSLAGLEWAGFAFLVLGSVALALAEPKGARLFLAAALLAAGALLGLSSALAKEVFAETGFISGLIWIKAWGIAAALGFLFSRSARAEIFGAVRRPEARGLFIGGRLAATLGSFLLYFAISLAHPALVEATQGARYAFVFAAAWLLLGENFRGKILALKIFATFLIALGLGSLALGEYAKSLPAVPAERPIVWGVTFSEKFSRELGLDWRANYLAILDELKPARLRLIAYWDEIEREPGARDFASLDWQLDEAERRGVPVILALGLKMPRWPECHAPDWAEALPEAEEEKALSEHVLEVVLRYRDRASIIMWQVENEPFLMFGACRARLHEFFHGELALVRALDPERPVLLTDGGELGLWTHAARDGDVFGTTMYRKVYPKVIGPLFGVIEYPLGPDYFRVKERFVRWWTGKGDQRFIVIELQGEPWSPVHLRDVPFEDQIEMFSPAYFADTIEYAKRAGFEEYYLWGAEWWWWMKEVNGTDEYWNYARQLYRH